MGVDCGGTAVAGQPQVTHGAVAWCAHFRSTNVAFTYMQYLPATSKGGWGEQGAGDAGLPALQAAAQTRSTGCDLEWPREWPRERDMYVDTPASTCLDTIQADSASCLVSLVRIHHAALKAGNRALFNTCNPNATPASPAFCSSTYFSDTSTMTIGVQTHDTSENLFTKKTEKEFFKEFEDAAVAQGKVAVLLKGFDRAESNLIIDARAYKLKQASREHTIQVRVPSLPSILCSPCQPALSEDMARSAAPPAGPHSSGPACACLVCTCADLTSRALPPLAAPARSGTRTRGQHRFR